MRQTIDARKLSEFLDMSEYFDVCERLGIRKEYDLALPMGGVRVRVVDKYSTSLLRSGAPEKAEVTE